MCIVSIQSISGLNVRVDYGIGDDTTTLPQLSSKHFAATLIDKITVKTTLHADEIWHRPPTSDPAISELMTEGCKLLMAPSRAPKVIPQGDGQLLEAEKIFSPDHSLRSGFCRGGCSIQNSMVILGVEVAGSMDTVPALIAALVGAEILVYINQRCNHSQMWA